MTCSPPDEVRADAANATTSDSNVVIELSDDHLQAWIRSADPQDPQSLTVEQIVRALQEAKIVVGEHVVQRIDDFLAVASNDQERPERFLVAQGCPAVEGKDEGFLRHEAFLQREQDWQGDAPINYYTYNSIHLVEKDDPIGTLIPAVPCADGIDACGEIVKALRRPQEVELDASVRRSEDDPTIVLANVAGQIDFSEGVLSIKEVLTVANDLDFVIGNIDSPIDVHILGTIHDGFTVKSSRAITIGGAIEAAEVIAQSNLLVHGGILQKGRSSVKSGGDIVARFCDEADLHADGDVKINKELMNSHVHCEGKLLAAHGAIIGGNVYAREGVEVAVLGSDANVKTEVAVGIHPDVIALAERIRENAERKKGKAEQIRRAIQPLIAEIQRLTPAQKEKATELMFEAHAIDDDIKDAEDKCSAMLQDARASGTPYVLVSKIVHQGVAVRIGRRITIFHKPMHGPLRIEKRKIENVTEFVAINQVSGSISVLSSSYVSEEPREEGAGSAETEHGGRDG